MIAAPNHDLPVDLLSTIPNEKAGSSISPGDRTSLDGNDLERNMHGGQDTSNRVLAAHNTGTSGLVYPHSSGLQYYFPGGAAPSAMEEVCAHVVGLKKTLIICDAFYHPLVSGSAAVRQYGLASFVGAPVFGTSNRVVGVVYATKLRMHRWTDEEVEDINAAASRIEEMLKSTTAYLSATQRSGNDTS
ncbi:hypothetical protein GCM10007385_32100 [Tateyamaria omphalii]|uniref:GAF domain-containing protein n=1 Tax=Tateyamaria omphalii TaxID=299262 RepID=UPI0019A1CCFB|nr:GAF domain-containing protein [Tateyamaria omphalii]GGX60413.1 hypothetical protein GCM10007385_32100 [Tateyamaria omphalii]